MNDIKRLLETMSNEVSRNSFDNTMRQFDELNTLLDEQDRAISDADREIEFFQKELRTALDRRSRLLSERADLISGVNVLRSRIMALSDHRFGVQLLPESKIDNNHLKPMEEELERMTASDFDFGADEGGNANS